MGSNKNQGHIFSLEFLTQGGPNESSTRKKYLTIDVTQETNGKMSVYLNGEKYQ